MRVPLKADRVHFKVLWPDASHLQGKEHNLFEANARHRMRIG